MPYEMQISRYIKHPSKYLFILVIGIVLFLIGYCVSWFQFEGEISAKSVELERLQERNEKLNSEVKMLRERIIELESDKALLKEEVESLNEELNDLISKLESKNRELSELDYAFKTHYDELVRVKDELKKTTVAIEKLRQDRELLSILRTTPPLNRTEAKIYWNDTRTALYRINPNLVPTVDAIMYYLDHYFDWYESLPRNATREQVCEWMFAYPIEAREYERNISKLREEIYMVIVTDLGYVLMVLEGVR